ncbi:hypothetical protein ACIA5C_40360 [Actinoplanes sp. NPDC051343]|uniref:hypothetical protein n=1 Tax=Actinoplanes sp. NPDC051343 TaxID=3363906 RepID=UPI0037A65272
MTVEQLVTRRADDDAKLVAEASRSPDDREFHVIPVTLLADPSFLDDQTRTRVVHAVERECAVSRTVERGA